TDFKWQAQFGGTVRFKGPFGASSLPPYNSIQHILKQGYIWGVPPERLTTSMVFAGPGLGCVEGSASSSYTVAFFVLSFSPHTGDDHKRQRKVMNPAFGSKECKALVPVFFASAASYNAVQLSNKWKDLLSLSKDGFKVINIPAWVSLAALDALGHSAFNYNFGAMENENNVLTSVYRTFFSDIFAVPTSSTFIAQAVISALPRQVAITLLKYMPDPRLARGRAVREVASKVAQELVEAKTKELLQGDLKSKDVLSLLVKANLSGNEKARLSEEELSAQMQIMFVVGHESTASTLSWTLLTLSRHPEVQSRLREELREKERQIALEGRAQNGLTADDLDALPYLNAVVKETLRYNSSAVNMPKIALQDDCLPLEEIITLGDGKQVTEIPVRKGQRILLSIHGYNRSKTIFGEDADTFRPERWLEDSGVNKATPLGVYSNLVYEIQAFITELISNFEFTTTPECRKVRREICGQMMSPVLEGELAKGPQCPLGVRYAKRDG
ncbi:hypothetical protein V5O48_006322, partial [Marasmius crinis-equi]